MLQQTRVEAVKPYYARFLEACPNVRALAEIDDAKLLKLWEGLGYYSRARNLKKAAQAVLERYQGQMPKTYEELLSLPGIGAYTAGAVASIAYDIRVPAVDGNVLRVLSRCFGIYKDISLQETKDAFRVALQPTVPSAAGDFTQALIELGATVCIPNGEAKCESCPFAEDCFARLHGEVHALPVKPTRKARKIELRTVLLIRDGDHTVLSKRSEKGLLAGLYELPNTKGHLSETEVTAYVRSLGLEPLRVEPLEPSKHIFTHIEWHMIAYSVRISSDFDGWKQGESVYLVSNSELHSEYAIPSAFSAYTRYL